MSYQDQDQRGLGEGRRDRRLQTANLWETLEGDGRFGRLVAAARAAELENNLRGPGFMTVFAVPDQNLADVDDDTLRAAVTHHVIRGMQKEADLRTAGTVKAIDGATMPVSRQGATVRFGEATLVRSDIPCTNGMLHIVDRLAREFSHAT